MTRVHTFFVQELALLDMDYESHHTHSDYSANQQHSIRIEALEFVVKIGEGAYGVVWQGLWDSNPGS